MKGERIKMNKWNNSTFAIIILITTFIYLGIYLIHIPEPEKVTEMLPEETTEQTTEYEEFETYTETITAEIFHVSDAMVCVPEECGVDVCRGLPEDETVDLFCYYESVPLSEEFQRQIYDACAAEEMSYELILAMMYVETRWTWHDGDEGNAIGYMQIWPLYWSDFAAGHGVSIYDPYGNVVCGIKIMDYLLDKNEGNLTRALTEYNAGDPDIQNAYAANVYAAMELIY